MTLMGEMEDQDLLLKMEFFDSNLSSRKADATPHLWRSKEDLCDRRAAIVADQDFYAVAATLEKQGIRRSSRQVDRKQDGCREKKGAHTHGAWQNQQTSPACADAMSEAEEAGR